MEQIVSGITYEQFVADIRMKAKDYDVEDIAEITGLTVEEIEAL